MVRLVCLIDLVTSAKVPGRVALTAPTPSIAGQRRAQLAAQRSLQESGDMEWGAHAQLPRVCAVFSSAVPHSLSGTVPGPLANLALPLLGTSQAPPQISMQKTAPFPDLPI